MGRARGANAQMLLKHESTYGTVPGGNFFKMPFANEDLGETQALVASELLGYGRDPLRPALDIIDNRGSLVCPLDLRSTGLLLKSLFGAPTTTQGVAATGNYLFSAQPADSATITVGGQAFTFVPSAPAANQILKGATLAATIANAVIALNASTVAGVLVASYASDLAGTTILITYDTIGTGGNAMTIVAGSSPASNATASGATLSGGATTGQYNHVFTSGALSLPSASIEIGNPEVPSYRMNFGIVLDGLQIAMQRSGNLVGTIPYIAQGENASAGTSSGGTPVIELGVANATLQRFTQFSGQVNRDGVPLGNLVSSNWNYANGIDPVEIIRNDGRIGGADAGMASVNITAVMRYADTTLIDLSRAGSAVELRHMWSVGGLSSKSLTLITHQVDLPRPKLPVTGSGGIQATFNFQGSQLTSLGRMVTAILVNDVSSY